MIGTIGTRSEREGRDRDGQVGDVLEWEGRHGRIPEGSVVMVRSDWYKR